MGKHTIKREIWKYIYSQNNVEGCLPAWLGEIIFLLIIIIVVALLFMK
jgi:hypothetical protein